MLQAAAFAIALALVACSGAPAPAAPQASSATTGRPAQPSSQAPRSGAADELVTRLLALLDAALRERPDDGVALYQRAALSVEAGASADALAFLRRLDAIGW